MNKQIKPLKVTITTFGCQMNEYDSEVVTTALTKEGCVIAPSEEAADVVILNTCSVRDHAENKAFNKLHVLSRAKRNGRGGLTLGLMGCMADNYKEKLLKDFPELDFIAGTRNVKDVVRLIKEVGEKRAEIASSSATELWRTPRNDTRPSDGRPQGSLLPSKAKRKKHQLSAISTEGWWEEYADTLPQREGVRAFLPIMTGCDNLCTYCIVPKTRGREVSMRGGKVVDQVRRLVDQGYKEIQLLGQNVNSYGKRYVGEDESYRTRREPSRFPELVAACAEVPGIERISWMTSHPKDASRELFEVMRDYPKVTHWFHLPLQSGASPVLKRMGREYSIEEFRERLGLLRACVPDASVTTDIIVGFSGETEEDFEETRRTLEEFRFDSAFIFKYSVRAGTPGERLPDDVPERIKEARHAELLSLQKRISTEKNESLIGTATDVLVSGKSRHGDRELVAQNRLSKRVMISGPESWIGSIKQVKLTGLRNETFQGEVIA